MKKEDFIKQMKDKYSHLAETNKRASVITGRVIEIIENYQPIYRGNFLLFLSLFQLLPKSDRNNRKLPAYL